MTKPHIDIDEFTKNYLDEHSRSFSFESILSNSRRKQALNSIWKYKHKNILEIGCGLNPLYPYIADYEKYTIVEPGTKFLETIMDDGFPNVIILNGFLEDIYQDLLGERFDFIVLSSVLHIAPQPSIILKAISQICTESTIVHISVPNAYSFHRLLALEMGYIDTIFEKSETNAKSQANWVFDRNSLQRIVQENGFEVLDFGTFFLKFFTNSQMEKVIDSGIVGEGILQGLENMVKYLPDMGCEMFVDLRLKDSD